MRIQKNNNSISQVNVEYIFFKNFIYHYRATRNRFRSNESLIFFFFNPLSASPTKWSNTRNNLLAKVDKLFQCVWPFRRLVLKGLTKNCFRINSTFSGKHLSPKKQILISCVKVTFSGQCNQSDVTIFSLASSQCKVFHLKSVLNED